MRLSMYFVFLFICGANGKEYIFSTLPGALGGILTLPDKVSISPNTGSIGHFDEAFSAKFNCSNDFRYCIDSSVITVAIPVSDVLDDWTFSGVVFKSLGDSKIRFVGQEVNVKVVVADNLGVHQFFYLSKQGALLGFSNRANKGSEPFN